MILPLDIRALNTRSSMLSLPRARGSQNVPFNLGQFCCLRSRPRYKTLVTAYMNVCFHLGAASNPLEPCSHIGSPACHSDSPPQIGRHRMLLTDDPAHPLSHEHLLYIRQALSPWSQVCCQFVIFLVQTNDIPTMILVCVFLPG